MVRSHFLLTLIATFFLAGNALPDEGAAALSALARMPVKEVTIFKDGHAFVLHEGKMPTSQAGNVELDYLPTPVIGTFWPYSSDKKARLTSVVAAKRRVLVEQTALGLRDLLEGNVGADIIVNEGTAPYPATIVGFPTRTSKELEATSPPQADPPLPQKGELILLKTAEGTKAVNLNRIVDVKFLNKYKTTLANEEFRNLLTLKLDWTDGKAQPAADVGLMYLQQGMRWIPNYLVELDGAGKANVKLQATLLNEMTDLDNVTVNLVVGVPSFLFKDTIDPMALGQTLARLTTYMESDQRMPNSYSNSIMTQAVRTNNDASPRASPDLGPEVAGSGKNEDLFLFSVHGITLKKGQRAVVPIAQYALEYKDLYTLDLPFAPPPELHNIVNDAQRAELARLLSAPKVEHKIRLVNKNNQPLTTAPTLIVNKGRVLAQSMMTYTSAGGYTDLPVTAAVDIKAKKSEKEAKRSPNAAEWNGQHFWRLDLAGSVHLCNLRGTAAELEVTRYVLGNVNEADHQGKTEMVNVLEDTSFAPASAPWLSGYNWPIWWQHFNGVGRITWNLKLDPGASVDLGYTWHYFRN